MTTFRSSGPGGAVPLGLRDAPGAPIRSATHADELPYGRSIVELAAGGPVPLAGFLGAGLVSKTVADIAELRAEGEWEKDGTTYKSKTASGAKVTIIFKDKDRKAQVHESVMTLDYLGGSVVIT